MLGVSIKSNFIKTVLSLIRPKTTLGNYIQYFIRNKI